MGTSRAPLTDASRKMAIHLAQCWDHVMALPKEAPKQMVIRLASQRVETMVDEMVMQKVKVQSMEEERQQKMVLLNVRLMVHLLVLWMA